MKTVEIYTKSWCGYCRMAKALLSRLNITFQEIDVTHDPDKEKEMIARSGSRTVPQIFIDNAAIGGFLELSQLAATDKVRELTHDREQPD